jgi:hypothetical protein
MRLGLPSLLGRPAAPPLKWGLVVAASLIMAETLVLYPLKRIAFENTLGVVYLLGVVVVAIVWGFGWRLRRRWSASWPSTTSISRRSLRLARCRSASRKCSECAPVLPVSL